MENYLINFIYYNWQSTWNTDTKCHFYQRYVDSSWRSKTSRLVAFRLKSLGCCPSTFTVASPNLVE